MSLRPIVLYPDPVLRRVALPVAEIDAGMQSLAADMIETMYDAKGRGLAAPQVGLSLRLFVMDCGWKEGPKAPRVFFNPEIAAASDTLAVNTEGCLSIPDVPTLVARPDWVRLVWTDETGAHRDETFTGFEAVAVQHELDHLNGRLCIDLIAPEARPATLTLLERLET